MVKRLAVWVMAAGVFLAVPAAGQVPSVLNFSGRLGTDAGDFTGVADVKVTLYDDATSAEAAHALWTDLQDVYVDAGRFHLLLGADPGNPLPDGLLTSAKLFVGVSVNGETEMAPRMRVASVPFALYASDTRTLGGVGPEGFAAAGHTHGFTGLTGAVSETQLPAGVTMDAELAAGLAGKSDVGHNHDGAYSPVDHNHDATYVNEGQADSVTSEMVMDRTLLPSDLADWGCQGGQVVKWFAGTGWACGDDLDTTTAYLAGTGLKLAGLEFSVDEAVIRGWCYDQPTELYSFLDTRYSAAGHDHDAAYYRKSDIDAMLSQAVTLMQSQLASKADKVHAHAVGDVTGLQTSVEGWARGVCYDSAAELAAALPGWDTKASDDVLVDTVFGGDVTGTYNNLQVVAGAIGSPEIADGAVSGSKIFDCSGPAQDQYTLKWSNATGTWSCQPDNGMTVLPAHSHPGSDITSAVASCTLAADSVLFGGETLAQVQADCLNGVAAVGYLRTTDKVSPVQLPAGGLNEVSNNLLWNQFVSTISATDTPVSIHDYYPPGNASTITFPNLGTAEKLTVGVDVSNSNVSGLTLKLYDPNNVEYVLYDRGSTGATWKTSYPDPTTPVSGDLATWVGKNPAGTWRLLAIDSHFDNKSWPNPDGYINAWSISVQYLSNGKVEAKGDLVVDGNLTVGGTLTLANNTGLNADLVDGKHASDLAVAATAPLKTTGMTVSIDTTGCRAGDVLRFDGTAFSCQPGVARGTALYRWNDFHTYFNGGGWLMGDSAAMFGGIAPSAWTDNNYRAGNISADKEAQRTLFNRKGYAGKNAMVISDTYFSYSSTDGHVVVALFRIRNTTASAIAWPLNFYYSSYGGWAESAGVALNGVEQWFDSGSNYSSHAVVSLTIPANRTSTVIVNATSGPGFSVGSLFQRSTVLGFDNNSLGLPAGLEYVDDLDTATGGWTQ